MSTPDPQTPSPFTSMPSDPLVGTVLAERYRVRRKLGEGGMGAVYEAEHELIGRRVAVKVLHSEYAHRGDVITRFRREALAASRIGNEHIVEVTDMGELPDGSVFLVLEYLDGTDLSALLEREGVLTLGRVARIVSQLCEALSAAHAAGIVHRDLKPENVFLIERGENRDFVKLLDFGIARFRDENNDTTSLTRTGMAIGTPNYMSPEQADGVRDLDHRADVYALGVMLFVALTGEFPFDAPSFVALVVKIAREPAPDPRAFRPDLPAPVAELVLRCLAKKREDRPANCADVRAALRPYLHDEAKPRVIARSDTVLATDVLLAAASSPSAAGPERVTEALPARGSTARTAMILGGVLVVAGAFGVVASSFGRGRANTEAIEARLRAEARARDDAMARAAASASASALASANAGPTGGAQAPERTVHIRLRTEPARAQVLLDGLPIANPFDGELPYSRELHRLEVRAPGYQDVLQDLALHVPQNVEVVLERGRGVQDRRSNASARPVEARPSNSGTSAPHDPTAATPTMARATALAAPTASAAPSARPAAVPSMQAHDLGGVAPTVPVQEF